MAEPTGDRWQSLLAAAETGSLSAAARVPGLSQPTLSRHIATLEAAVGAALFTRAPQGLAPTPAALALTPGARALAMAMAALARTAAAGAGRSGAAGRCGWPGRRSAGGVGRARISRCAATAMRRAGR